MSLTQRQVDALRIIAQALTATGSSPSYGELGAALGVRSKSSVHRLITGLEARGYIRRIPMKTRAIEIIKTDEPTVRDDLVDALRFARGLLLTTAYHRDLGRIDAALARAV